MTCMFVSPLRSMSAVLSKDDEGCELAVGAAADRLNRRNKERDDFFMRDDGTINRGDTATLKVI